MRGVVYPRGNGRPQVVFGCKCKANELEHEFLITDVELSLGREFVRDARVGRTQADGMFIDAGEDGPTTFYVEVDNDTMSPKQMRAKWDRYGKVKGYILVICHTTARMRRLMRTADVVEGAILFTLFRWLRSEHIAEPWIDLTLKRTGI